MPAINPNNYNIDFFNTYSFGDIIDNRPALNHIAPSLHKFLIADYWWMLAHLFDLFPGRADERYWHARVHCPPFPCDGIALQHCSGA